MKVAFQTGKAFKMIERGNYLGGAKLLESLCEKKDKNIEYTYYRIGDCYYRLKKYDVALRWLKKSFDIYRSNLSDNRQVDHNRWFRDAKKMYIETLKLTGNIEMAKVIRSKTKNPS